MNRTFEVTGIFEDLTATRLAAGTLGDSCDPSTTACMPWGKLLTTTALERDARWLRLQVWGPAGGLEMERTVS